MLQRISDSRFISDKEQAQRSAREQLKIIVANADKLLMLRGGKKLSDIAFDFYKQKENFTNKQLSFIDSIYERTMEAAGFESFAATYKPRRRF